MKRPLRVRLLEPFFGGSHREAAEGWAAHSRHTVAVDPLPPRHWKWRMRGAAFEYARRLRDASPPDVLFATSLLDLAHLKALLPWRCACLLYFHENQAAYPERPGVPPGERDLQYAFTNLAAAAAAEHVAFNSQFQRSAFLSGMDSILRRMPDARPRWVLAEIEAKSSVLPLGIDADAFAPQPEAPRKNTPLVLWNHRWEHDKAPETFFRTLFALAARDVPFRLAVAGEAFARTPPIFAEARERLADRIVHWGFVTDRAAYRDWVRRADVVVSTALQENFGLSMIEAACAGAHPLAPNRLSYPEVIPHELHGACLYADEQDLESRLERLLTGVEERCSSGCLHRLFRRYGWPERAAAIDARVVQVFESTGMCYK